MGTDGSGTEVPDSIRSMLTAAPRPPARRRAPTSSRLAAVAERLSTLPVLVAATELDADEVLDAADVAVAAGPAPRGRRRAPRARRTPSSARPCSGGSARPAARTSTGASPARCARPSGSEVSAAELAHHALAAGEPRRRAPSASPPRVAAGEEALQRVAYEEARGVGRARPRARRPGDARPTPPRSRCSTARPAGVLGDRGGAEAAARRAARIAGRAVTRCCCARAAEAWVLSISGVGFAIGEARRPRADRASSTTPSPPLPADAVEHQVWLRSMLVSVLVETGQFERQEQLSDEALAIAGRSRRPRVDGVRAVRPPPRAVAPRPPRRAAARSRSRPSSTPAGPATSTSS